MLQRIRDGLQGQKWLAYTVLGVLALVFAAWGAYGIVEFNVGPGNHALEVNGETVSMEEVREAWMRRQSEWQQRFGIEIPAEERRRMQDQLLEAFTERTLLLQRAREAGYRVTQERLAETIRTYPAFQLDGKYDPNMAKAALAQLGLTPAAFEADLRRALQMEQIELGIRSSDFLTPAELERLRALENQEREVRYLTLPPEKFAGDAPVDDAAVQAYYEAHKDEFLTPESVRLRYAELRLDQLPSQVVVTDKELRQAYEKSKDEYVVPERRRARHILIEASGGVSDAEAQKEAQEVLAQAQAGADFAELAKKHSDDVGSASQGGDLGWVERDFFPGPFGDALFSMSAGEVRGPVKTESGYHIIRLEEIQPGKSKSFEEARDELEARVREELAAERFGDLHEQIEASVEQGAADFDRIVEQFGLQTGEVAEFLRGGGGAPLGASPDLQEVVFSDAVLAEKRIGGPVVLGEDRLVIVKALEHRKPEPRPVAEVRDQIVAAIRKERGTEAAVKAAEAARARLESGTDFEAVAKDLGVKAEPARFVGRGDPSLPAQVRETVFSLPKPEGKPLYRSIQLDQGGAALIAVTDVRVAKEPDDPNLQAALRRRAAARRASGDIAAYIAELRRTADVDKNPRVFD